MKREPIVQFGNPVLRQIASPVTVFHKKLCALIDTMKFTLESDGCGAALAAPQIGVLKRVVVIDYQGEYLEMVNPLIIEMSGSVLDEEGCLSFVGYNGKVMRSETVTVKFCDRTGIEKVISRSGPFARCIQHEVDHLDGILYIDRMEKSETVYNDDNDVIPVNDAINLAGQRI